MSIASKLKMVFQQDSDSRLEETFSSNGMKQENNIVHGTLQRLYKAVTVVALASAPTGMQKTCTRLVKNIMIVAFPRRNGGNKLDRRNPSQSRMGGAKVPQPSRSAQINVGCSLSILLGQKCERDRMRNAEQRAWIFLHMED